MPAEYQFLVVAVLLYAWELILWIPVRGRGFRARRKGWRSLDPRSVLVLRDRGAVFSWPLLADSGFHVATPFPLILRADGRVWLDLGNDQWKTLGKFDRAKCHRDHLDLVMSGQKVPLLSAAESDPFLADLKADAANDGTAAIQRAWERSFSLPRARAALKKWRLFCGPFLWLCPLLTIAFFGVLPFLFFKVGGKETALFGLWTLTVLLTIQVLMVVVGGRIFPKAKGAFWGEAIISLLLPFHAMRATRHGLPHAFAGVHPVALLLAAGQTKHPYLNDFARRLRNPRPGNEGDAAWVALVQPLFQAACARAGAPLPAEIAPAPEPG
ncbi:MAG: hypothetical protein ACKO2G_03895, partial [Verrucomicrobiales bacterium]